MAMRTIRIGHEKRLDTRRLVRGAILTGLVVVTALMAAVFAYVAVDLVATILG